MSPFFNHPTYECPPAPVLANSVVQKRDMRAYHQSIPGLHASDRMSRSAMTHGFLPRLVLFIAANGLLGAITRPCRRCRERGHPSARIV